MISGYVGVSIRRCDNNMIMLAIKAIIISLTAETHHPHHNYPIKIQSNNTQLQGSYQPDSLFTQSLLSGETSKKVFEC